MSEVRSSQSSPLPTPADLIGALPVPAAVAAHIAATRAEIRRTLSDPRGRLVVVVGPCSIHDIGAALDYARWLRDMQARYASRLLLVMRAYVEKARTRIGWKGLLNDPRLDGSGAIADGLWLSRELMLRINELGLPVATEFVEVTTPAYLGDLVSWAAVGARTSESQTHREMASRLACPVGFKNSTTGNVEAAINAVVSAREAHRFAALDDNGRLVAVTSAGNAAGHVVLRGGDVPNYSEAAVRQTAAVLRLAGLPARVMVDCGHGNCQGHYGHQQRVAAEISRQLASGSTDILGVMIESNLEAGAQLLGSSPLVYGQSITDGCIDQAQTLDVLDGLFAATAGGHMAARVAG